MISAPASNVGPYPCDPTTITAAGIVAPLAAGGLVFAAVAVLGANLVDGAYSLGLFGDVATEMCIRTDGDEGLFAGLRLPD